MNKIYLVLCLAIAIQAVACGQTGTETNTDTSPIQTQAEVTSDWQSLSFDQYTMTYPSDWEADTSGQLGTRFFIFSPLANESDAFRENVNLVIQDLTGYDMDLDQYAEISEGQIQTAITEGQIISSERKEKDGQAYHQMIYTGKQGIFDLKFEQHYWVKDNQAFVLTFTCEEKAFDAYQATGEKMLGSFAFNTTSN
ncbi:MAG: PsbP-related protein [Bacteroidota bacterium]